MKKKSIITILLALVAVAGQAQENKYTISVLLATREPACPRSRWL